MENKIIEAKLLDKDVEIICKKCNTTSFIPIKLYIENYKTNPSCPLCGNSIPKSNIDLKIIDAINEYENEK